MVTQHYRVAMVEVCHLWQAGMPPCYHLCEVPFGMWIAPFVMHRLAEACDRVEGDIHV